MDEKANAIQPTEGRAASQARSARFALKDGDTVVVCDAYGDIDGEADGLYHNDTRMLSHLALRIGGEKPNLLSAVRGRDNVILTSNMENPAFAGAPAGAVHLARAKLLWDGRLHERIWCVNYGVGDVVLPLSLQFNADFVDMFEVRGATRPARGRIAAPHVAGGGVALRYEGLDGLVRTTTISFSEAPSRLAGDEALFLLRLAPRQIREVLIEIATGASEKPDRQRHRRAAVQARRTMRQRLWRGARLSSSDRLFEAWIARARADLALLTTDLATGPFPYAGIPWFSTAFGRDSIITALQGLWLDPGLARGVLTFLAQTQAHEFSAFKDSEPGKVLHEMRKGEMNATGELPFAQYYGGVDTTPLFVMLAGAYADRTGDLALIDKLWPAIAAAVEWIDRSLAADPRGFVSYHRAETTGLANQGWKDSSDSVFHADGRLADGPVALVEVQGYAYAALEAVAGLAERRGDSNEAERRRASAAALRDRVERQFWMEEAGFYGIALDGAGALCRVLASNPGHLLYCGLPSRARALRVAERLASPEFDTGWGVRTLAAGEARYNPMSYHNGSVWPHDSALCAAGLARYSAGDAVVRLLGEMFSAAVIFDMQLPELFCGFRRAAGDPPIAHPVACLPQAWAAGAPLMMAQACLGVRIDGWRREIHVQRPRLPDGVDRIVVRRLTIGAQQVDLSFERVGEHVAVTPLAMATGAEPIAVIVHA